jgi:hypothetical protein
LFFAVRGNCCGRGDTLPAFASFTNLSMSVFSFALALLVPLAGSLTSGEVAGSLVLAPLAKTDVEQTQSANASTSGNAKSFFVINSPGEFFEWGYRLQS